MKKIVPITLFVCLVVSLLSSLSMSRSVKELNAKNIELSSKLANYNYNAKRDKERFSLTVFSENKPISNVYLLDSELDSISFSSIVIGQKLIYRFYETTCVQCVEDELDIIENLANSIGKDNIIIITDFQNSNRAKAIFKRKNITSPFYFYRKRFDLPIDNMDDQDVASFFVLNQNLVTQFVYKAGGEQNINDAYYQRIISFFQTGI